LKFKVAAVKFIIQYSAMSEYYSTSLLPLYFEPIMNNINIVAHVKESFTLINLLLSRSTEPAQHILRCFKDLLNLAEEAKIMALRCLGTIPPE
jgi:hypothetical protein